MSLLVPYRSVSDYNEHMFLLILFHSDKLQKPLALYSYEYLPPDCNNQSPFLVISVFFSASFQGQVSMLPYKDALLNLASPNVPFKTKKRVLVQEGSSFIEDVLAPVVSSLGFLML